MDRTLLKSVQKLVQRFSCVTD